MVKINYKVKTLNMISYLSSDQIFINYTEEGHRFNLQSEFGAQYI